MTPTSGTPIELGNLLTDEDIGAVADCAANNLLRLSGNGTAIDPGSGKSVVFTVRLFVVSIDLMYGTTTGNVITEQGPMTATRAISMSR